jgi:hypothetical protein
MIIGRPRLVVVRSRKHFYDNGGSSHRLLKTALWFVWLPIIGVAWMMLLDTSYDWISSPSTTRVIGGLLILISMGCVIVLLLIKGARRLWTRRG